MAASKPPITDRDDPIMANPEAVAEIAQRAFARAKDQALAENERLGVPSYGTGGAKPGRRPRQKRKRADAELHQK